MSLDMELRMFRDKFGQKPWDRHSLLSKWEGRNQACEQGVVWMESRLWRETTQCFLGPDKEFAFYARRSGKPVEAFQQCVAWANEWYSLLDDLNIIKVNLEIR